MKRLLALVVLGAVIPCCCKRHPQSTQSSQSPADAGVPATVESVNRDNVAGIAREYCKGLLEIPTDCVPTVEETFATFVVVFPVKYDRPMRGPDYYAKVTVDKKTGKVTQVLAGS